MRNMKLPIIALLAMSFLLNSCADEQKRYEYLKMKYPSDKIYPSFDYNYTITDSSNNVIGLTFYPFSNTKVFSLQKLN